MTVYETFQVMFAFSTLLMTMMLVIFHDKK